MEFYLYYRGSLHSNGGNEEKQRLRRIFQTQLKDLWRQKPLNELQPIFLGDNSELSALRKVGSFVFAPLVNVTHNLVAKLTITMLRPEEPGSLVTRGGDIDNRLKTLLDALSMPKPDQIPAGDVAQSQENPFHCLLEDDNLITSLSVTVDRLLDSENKKEIVMLIHVHVTATRTSFENLAAII